MPNGDFNNKYVRQYTNNTYKEQLVISLYHNNVLHTIHNSILRKPKKFAANQPQLLIHILLLRTTQ